MTFPMSASDARIAAREDEYTDYLACLRLATATTWTCSYCGEDTTECRQAARLNTPCGA